MTRAQVLKVRTARMMVACQDAGDLGAANEWRKISQNCHDYSDSYVEHYLRVIGMSWGIAAIHPAEVQIGGE